MFFVLHAEEVEYLRSLRWLVTRAEVFWRMGGFDLVGFKPLCDRFYLVCDGPE